VTVMEQGGGGGGGQWLAVRPDDRRRRPPRDGRRAQQHLLLRPAHHPEGGHQLLRLPVLPDPRRYPCHGEFLRYIWDFCDAFGIMDVVR
jgi:hypothetical protein